MRTKSGNTCRVWAIFNTSYIKKDADTFFLVLLVAAIFFSPRFFMGSISGGRSIDIRIEDILLLILGIRWLFNFSIYNRKSPPFIWQILAWIGIGLLTTSINLFLGNIYLDRSFFYFLKEIEYFFLFFYVFYHIKDVSSIIYILKSFFIFGVINLGWLLFQIISGHPAGEYVPSGQFLGVIGEGSPSITGGFSLILFINLFPLLLFTDLFPKKKKILSAAVISGFILGIISTMRKIHIFSFVLSFMLLILIYLFKRKKHAFMPHSIKNSLFLVISVVVLSIMLVSLLYIQDISVRQGLLNRGKVVWELNHRVNQIWKIQLKAAFSGHPWYIFLGRGKSVFLKTEECHSQYVRNLIETGLIGSLVFFILIFAILKKLIKSLLAQTDPLKTSLISGVLLSTIAMLVVSFFAEAFLVVRINEVYWFFMGMAMAAIAINNKEKLTDA